MRADGGCKHCTGYEYILEDNKSRGHVGCCGPPTFDGYKTKVMLLQYGAETPSTMATRNFMSEITSPVRVGIGRWSLLGRGLGAKL
jgi:hypothetical protein